ncbi:MAG: Flp family type IVb pilin [Desulfobacterium sp.]|jgi:pilus assembly protein Flp/PilA|nr:Flp family type IVb pilin [Desulfobacterium sp.]
MEKTIAFLKEEHGATAAEYAIIASLIAAVIVVAVTLFGLAVQNLFEKANTEMEKL